MNKQSLLIAIIALLSAQTSLAAEPIGRLFTTPAERGNLDYLRNTKKNAPAKAPEIAPTPAPPPEPIALPNQVNLQGYVKRNDGKQGTVWINNQAMQESSANSEVMVGKLPKSSNRVPIKISGNGKIINLKAGQVYEPESNRVREARNHGAQGDAGRISDESAAQ